MTDSVLRVEDLGVSYGASEAVRKLDFDIKRGDKQI